MPKTLGEVPSKLSEFHPLRVSVRIHFVLSAARSSPGGQKPRQQSFTLNGEVKSILPPGVSMQEVLPCRDQIQTPNSARAAPLCFFPFFFTLPKLTEELARIQKKPGKNSLVQRSSLSETNGLSYSLGHCFKATNTDVQLWNKHESPGGHQSQSQQN